jgi:predicted permease
MASIRRNIVSIAAVLAALSSIVVAQTSCSSSIAPSYSAPVVAKGFSARIVANGFNGPRMITFDSEGHLLILEKGQGITAVTFNDAGGNCLSVASQHMVVNDTSVC